MIKIKSLHAVQRRRCNLKPFADLSYRPAAAEVGFENLENKPKAVLTIRNEHVLQKSMGMTAGTFDATDVYPVSFRFSFPQIDYIAGIMPVIFKHSSGSAGRTMRGGKIRYICFRICKKILFGFVLQDVAIE